MLLKEASDYYKAGHYYKAIDIYKDILKKSGKQKEALVNIADCYHKTNNIRMAIRYYKVAVELLPSNHEIKYKYAQALMTNGNYEDAGIWFKKYAFVHPEDIRAEHSIDWCNNVDLYLQDSAAYQVEAHPVNSRFSEFCPILYDNQLVFASGRPSGSFDKRDERTGETFLDLFSTQKINVSTWDDAVRLVGRSQSKFNDGPVCFSRDEMKMYLTRNTSAKGGKTSTLKIIELTLKNGSWANPVDMPFNSEDNKYSVGHPSIANDGKTLYFTSDMPGGFGGKDLYKSVKENGEWSAPINLGYKINTPGNEMFPFIHQDGTLYFASDGFGGFGGLDVLSTTEIKGRYSSPTNVGYPINTPQDDFGLIFNKTKKVGYISSNRKGGKGKDDLYILYVSEEKAQELVVKDENIAVEEVVVQKVEEEEVPLKDVGLNTTKEVPIKEVSLSEPEPIQKPNSYTVIGKVMDYNTLNGTEGSKIELLILDEDSKYYVSDMNGNFYFEVFDNKDHIVLSRTADGYIEDFDIIVYAKNKIIINSYLKINKDRSLGMETHKTFVEEFGDRLPDGFFPATRTVAANRLSEDNPKDTFDINTDKTYADPLPLAEVKDKMAKLLDNEEGNPVIDLDAETEAPAVFNENTPISNLIVEVDMPTITYKVQIGSFSRQLSSNDAYFAPMNGEFIEEYDFKHYRYLAGNYGNFRGVKKYLIYLQGLGYEDAYIVTYVNGRRQEEGLDRMPSNW